jgi:hypothetical protein
MFKVGTDKIPNAGPEVPDPVETAEEQARALLLRRAGVTEPADPWGG